MTNENYMRRHMNNKFLTIMTVLLISVLVISPVGAKGIVQLSTGTSFTLGSLIANGTVFGLGNTDWIIQLAGDGHAEIVCTNQGGNSAPGQNFPHVERTGSQLLDGDSQLRKNGKAPFSVETEKEDATNTIVPWDVAGCANSNWTAKIVFVFWDHATIYAIDPVTNAVVSTYDFKCVTTKTGPNSTPSTFDDGTVSCTRQ
jgi:hypothetical protein